MIELSAKIEIHDNKSLKLTEYENFDPNNISVKDISSLINTEKKVKNPFIIGTSKLNGKSTFSSGEDYFIGLRKSGAYITTISPQYIITISASSDSPNFTFDNFTIAFDTENNTYPPNIIIDNKSYDVEDSIFTATGLKNREQSSPYTHEIKISSWSVPNHPAIISGIYAGNSIEINKRNLIECSREIFDRSELDSVSYGVIANKGNISFFDSNGEAKDLLEQSNVENLKIEFFLRNTLIKGKSGDKKQKIGEYYIVDKQYDDENHSVNLSLNCGLEKMQDVLVDKLAYIPTVTDKQNFVYFYRLLWGKTNELGLDMATVNDLDEDTKSILQNSSITYPILESGSLWSQWQKLCEVCQFHLYTNSDGIIVCRYSKGD